MKKDIDSLMQSHNLDAILVTGAGQHNPPMVYLTGGGHMTQADLIKKRGEAPVLFYNPMERDEAAKSGLKTKNLDDYRIQDLIKQTGGNLLKARVMRYQQMLHDMGIASGRMAVYGKIDAGLAYATFETLQQAMPDLSITGEADNSVLSEAMATKDQEEVERIRSMGKTTVEVVGMVADYLTSHTVIDEVLVKPDDQFLTIGDVKKKINLWVAERGAEIPEGVIFTIGRDAAVPHSTGTATDVLRLGQTIVFDITPCEQGGGYYFDFTRTWCLGYAPDEVQVLYDNVHTVFQEMMQALKPNLPGSDLQTQTCDLFEAKGHPTPRSNPVTQDGYVHSLGHGIGLHVHEPPFMRINATPADTLLPGSVFTVEPGLYYPEKGMGVRLENTVWMRPDGTVQSLADYPLDLVLRMKN